MNELREEYLQQLGAALASTPEDIPTLGRLIATLEQQWELVEGLDETWERAYWDHWPALEEVYAVALDRGKATLDQVDNRILVESIQHLRSVVAAAAASRTPSG